MTQVTDFVAPVLTNVEKVIVGKRSQVEYLLVALLCQANVLIEDVPGTGKTMLARAVAASLGISFKRIQCTPDLLPNDITGVSIYNQKRGEFEFRPGPVFVNILLADEINRATPRTQAALLEAMQEKQVTMDGVTHKLPQPFLVLATQNPIEQEGTFPLPEAQLDRFLFKLSMGYPSEEQEIEVLRRVRGQHPVEQVEPVVDGATLLALRAVVSDVHLDETLEHYIMTLVTATRRHPDVAMGASTRGAISLYQAAQALAAIRGRDHVIPEDVKQLAPLTLTHRLIVRPESQLRGRTAAAVVNDILTEAELELEGRTR